VSFYFSCSQNKKLTLLHLNSNPIGVAGTAALKKALQVNIVRFSVFVTHVANVCLPDFMFLDPRQTKHAPRMSFPVLCVLIAFVDLFSVVT
jgi:hypothetical protein